MKLSADRFRLQLVCVGLVAIVWIVFGQTLGHEFFNFDDDKYVYDNPQISAGLSWPNIGRAFTQWHAALWHPLTTISHMIDCQFYGLRPGGHHLTNVVLHSFAVVLLFLVLVDLTKGSSRTGSIWCSAFVAALFAIHPMRVESVAWIAERKDVLSAVFLMLTIGAYARHARQPSPRRYLLVAVLIACGLMSKATFVTVPFVLLLLDYWPLHRGQRSEVSSQWSVVGGLVWEKIPLFALAVVASALTVRAQTVTISSLEQLPLFPRIKNAMVSTMIYVGQMFWPRDLAVFYPHPHDHLNGWLVLFCALSTFGISVAAILIRQKCPYAPVGWFWYLGMLIPVLGIVQAGVQGHADRFTYLPHIGLFILVTWAIADLTNKWRYRQQWLGAGAAVLLTTLAMLSWHQTTFWRNSVTLWTHTLAVTKNNAMAHQDLGAALWEQGKRSEANWHIQESNIIHWRTALKDFPFDVNSHDQLGGLLAQRGEIREAIMHWQTSLQIDPTDGNAANNLAWVLATAPGDDIRNGAKAVELAERAVHLSGGENPMVLRTLAAAYAESGRFAEAAQTAERAKELAEAKQNAALAETLRNEVKLYTASKPHREAGIP